MVVNTKVFQLSCSPSAFAKSNDIAGEVLKSVQPNPIGRRWKTFCCSNMPIFVPKKVEKIILDLFFIESSWINFLKFSLTIGNSTITLPSNLISVVWNGFRSEFVSTNLDSVAAITAHNTEKKAKTKPFLLSVLIIMSWLVMVFYMATPIKETLTITTPIHTFKVGISFKSSEPKIVAIIGEIASTVRVRRVPKIFKDLI